MAWYDTLINWGIPIGVIIFLFSIFYTKFREPFDAMFRGIKNVFMAVGGKGKKAVDNSYTVVYRYGAE
jgi:hypothetical protein